jgi:hypothetical protein
MDASAIDALERLGSLLERGLITQTEFDEQKRALLSNDTAIVQHNQVEQSSDPQPHRVPFFPISLEFSDGWNGYINRSIEWLLPQFVYAAEAQEFEISLQLMTDQLGNPAVSVFCSGKVFKHNGVNLLIVFSYIGDFSTQIHVDAEGGDVFGRSMSKWGQRVFETFNDLLMQREKEDAVTGSIQNPQRFFSCQSHYWNLTPDSSSNDYSRQLRMSLGDGQMINTPHAVCAVQAFSCTGTAVELEPVTSA